MTMTLISTVTVGSGGASTISISSIPQTYTDLRIVISARSNYSSANTDFCRLTFNGSTTGYEGRYLRGNGSGAQSSTTQGSNVRLDVPSDTGNSFSNAQYYVPNYTGSQSKSISAEYVTESNNTSDYQYFTSTIWANSSGITSVSIDSANGASFVQNSTMSIYGILKGSGGATAS